MAYDQVKQDANQTPLDGLSSIAETALAVGAGAAFLYRAGGDVLFSDDLNRLYRFKNALAFDINKTGTLRAGLDVWKQRAIDARDLWKATGQQTTEDFKFGEKASSIFDLLAKRYEFEQNDAIKRSVGRELYRSDILDPIFSSEQFNKLPTDLKDQLHDIIERAFTFRNQPARLYNLKNSITGELLKHKDIVDKVFDQLQERVAELPFSKTDIGYSVHTDQLWGDLDANKLRVNDVIKQRMGLLDTPEIYLEELQKHSKLKKGVHMFTGDRAITLRDMLEDDNIRKLFIGNRLVTDKNNLPVSAIDYLEETINSWKELYKDDPKKMGIINQILDSEFSQEFRVSETKDKNGNIIKRVKSFRGLDRLVDTTMEEYRNTLLGHLGKASELINITRQPETYMWHKGDFVPGLELAVSGKDEERLSADVIKVGSRFYKQEEEKGADGLMHTKLTYLELSPYLRTHSNETGAFKRTILAMYDKDGHRVVMDANDTGFFHDVLDLDLHIEIPITLTNDESEALGNNINYFRHIDIGIANKLAQGTISSTEVLDQVNRLNRFQSFIDRNTRSMSDKEIRNFRVVLRDALKNGELSQDMYRGLLDITQGHEVSDMVDDLSVNLGINPDKYLNIDLQDDLKTYKRRPKYFMTQYMRQHKDLATTKVADTIRETDLARDIFKRDIQQEVFMRIFSDYSSKHGPENVYRYARQLLERMRDAADMTDESIVEMRRLMMQSYITWSTGLNRGTIKTKNIAQMKGVVENVYDLMADGDEQFKKDFDSFAKQRSVGSGEEFVDRDLAWKPRIDTPKYGIHFANPSVGEVKDILNDMNLSTKEKAVNTAKTIFGMFIGGKGNSRQITPLTMLGPYNLVNRLMDPLASGALSTILGTKISLPRGLDVNFDMSFHNGRGNFLQISKNLMLKRILPIYIGMQFLDVTNDMQRQLTGMSTETSIRAGAANIDLGVRKILDATGLTKHLKNLKDSNVIWQYLDGSGRSFNSYSEQLDYYRNGYDPMRKGRFWAFGSANEFRGGQIEYWRPNALREATADAYDASLYGSLSNKWSHSLIPTPFSPLSPLKAILDPYWLERQHYYDRPYPFTGPMFLQGTPWGAVLNATIGEIIKPVHMMHRAELTGGVDTSVMLNVINSYIKQKAKDKDNGELFVLQNGRIEPKAFMAYNAPTPSTRILSATYNNGQIVNLNGQPYDAYRGGIDIGNYERQVNNDASQDFYTTNAPGKPLAYASGVPGDTKHIHQERVQDLSFTEKMAIRAGSRDNPISHVVYNMLNDMNKSTKQQAMVPSDSIHLDSKQGVYIPEKIRYEQSDFQKEVDKDSEIQDALHSQQGMGFVHSAAVSLRMVSGIYGWMGSLLGDYGEMNRPHIANASDMDSFSRRFWDQNMGGLGGDVMEILRRFIPTYGRYTAINPLKNTMPDWLPERFRMGDPYVSVPNGEERLPGVGYERLHSLHPDVYGRYGALDRYAILSDIAPYSPEAKFWKQIAAKTAAQSEEGKEEFKAIRDRANAANAHHTFYDYQFLHRGLDTQTVTIGEILGRGKFKIAGSDDVYTLAGITVQDNQKIGTDKVMMQYLQPGAEVTIKTDSNENYKRMNDTTHSISAAVYVNGENVSTQMVENGDARYKKSDTSAAATLGKYGTLTSAIGTVAEAVAHLDIPWIHSQFLRVETPLESYQHEHIYGTQYQTWNDFWGTFIKPGFMQGWGDYNLFTVGQVARMAHEWALKNHAESKKLLRLTDLAYMFTDRGAFIGNMVGFTAKLGASGANTFRRRMRNLGGNISLVGSLAVSYQFQNPLYMAATYGSFGYQAAKLINKFTPLKKRWGVAASLATGTALWEFAPQGGLRNDRGVWIPEKTREKWIMNDYFDRLTYIKMMGLYHKAAAIAKSKEGVDVERLFRIEDRDRIKKVQLKAQLMQAKQEIATHPSKAAQDALTVINKKLQALSSTKTVLRGGEYTKSAILYKQAADATMYGLKSDASMTDILRALPNEDRDYFMEFVQERDPDKRAEILRYSSPQLKRALRQMWGLDWRKPVSNEKFFQKFKLPGPTWKGWNPNVNLSDVKAKVVKNEGMLFSDFGVYESAYRKPNVINAPNIRNYRSSNDSALGIKAKLEANMRGLGLMGVDVSVEPKPSGGIQMAATVMNSLPQSLENAVEHVLTGD